MSFAKGNRDGKHYWLTPPELMSRLQEKYQFDFDACPYPLPEGFDGLVCPWGQRTWCNPPFGSIMHQGKKKGPTAWVKKALHEVSLGKKVVLVYPVYKWILLLLKDSTHVENLGDVRWCSIEDGLPGKGIGQHTALFELGYR